VVTTERDAIYSGAQKKRAPKHYGIPTVIDATRNAICVVCGLPASMQPRVRMERPTLADMAVRDPKAFTTVVKAAKPTS
jgi:ribosomal protein L20